MLAEPHCAWLYKQKKKQVFVMKNKKTFYRSVAAAMALFGLCTFSIGFVAAEGADGGTLIFHVDSVNGTRWEDTMVVYRDRAATGQNEWGVNVTVGADGKAIEVITSGDIRGKNLAIPKGGMVVTGTDEKGKWLEANISVGDNVVFDEYGSRILVSKGEINPFYKTRITFTGYNQPRYANTLIIYNLSGSTTATNGYGYEVEVGSDGIISAAGGNNRTVPEGGYVISAIEAADRDVLKTYFIPGARCTIEGSDIYVEYNHDMLDVTAKAELKTVKDELKTAEGELRLIDYAGIRQSIDELEKRSVSTLAERDEMIDEIRNLRRSLIEARNVEIRSTWYVPLEKNEKAVYETVAKMKSAGLNQLCLGIFPSMLKLYADFPFAPSAKIARFDILGAYVKACKEADIELVLSLAVFHISDDIGLSDKWLTVNNHGETGAEAFFSPANDEYIAFFSDYLTYIVTHYDIDGFQFDYIRYPYFDGTVDYGYDDETKKLFESETGLPASTVDDIAVSLQSHEKWADWVKFKTDLISRRVKEFSDLLNKLRPDIYVTAAVANFGESYFQDSSVWLSERWVDGIYPMSYAEGVMQSDTERFQKLITDSTFLVMGNGAYLSLTEDEMYLQTRDSALYGADGIAFFEWGAYVSHGYADSLANTLFSMSPALSVTYAEDESIVRLLETAEKRFNLYFSLNGTDGQDRVKTLFEQHSDDVFALYSELKAQFVNCDHLLQDLELASRIQKFSRSKYKGTIELIPVERDSSKPEESSMTVSEASIAEASGEEFSEPVAQDAEKGSRKLWPWIAVLGSACIAVVIAIKRKKK